MKIDFKPAQGESNIRNEDTVQLKIKGANINLMEKRKVGMEDWYYDDQGLQAMENLNENKIQISKTVIKKITRNSILFEFIIEFYTPSHQQNKFDSEEIWIDRKSLDGIIIKQDRASNSPNELGRQRPRLPLTILTRAFYRGSFARAFLAHASLG